MKMTKEIAAKQSPSWGATRLDEDVAEVLLEEHKIKGRVRELAQEIARDYEDKDLVLVSILKGSVVFLVDLIRELEIPCAIDFIEISSYEKTASTGVVRLIADLRESIQGKDVLIVEDIVDTGLTMDYLASNLKTRKPASLKVCSLLDKPENRVVEIQLDYLGFTIPNKFVVGYGLDYEEHYRNLPYIGVLKEGIYKEGIYRE